MINLMYVVLMAMLAMNVSTQVLDGFSIVDESLQRTTANAVQENQNMYDDFEAQMKSNPEKVRQWFEKATMVKRMSDSLYNFAQELKVEIVREADGAKGDVKNIDMKDIRVNKLSAFVIPNAQTIVRGDKFSAQIVMAAVDTTQQPQIYIGGRHMNLRNNTYEITTGSTGEFNLTGYITMQNGKGDVIRRDFSQKYTVVDPSATVSADLMNVLYAGYTNPISISIPGVPLNKVSATMSGGTLQPVGPGKYIARPASVGKDVTINVMSLSTGQARQVGQFTFHVRKLPDPTAYIAIGTNRYRGGGLAKASLMGVDGLKAAIDDGLLDIQFRVLSFETVFFDNMGNAVPMASAGASFSQRQKDAFRGLSRNRRFYISRVTAVGPDGITRTLPSSMEVIVK